MTIPFHLEDLSHGYGHSMLEWFPKPMGVIGDDGIPVDPEYSAKVIEMHCLRVYGGKGTPAPTSATAVREE